MKPRAWLLFAIPATAAVLLPVYGVDFLPSTDGPNHAVVLQRLGETLAGQHPELEVVFSPAYKPAYYASLVVGTLLRPWLGWGPYLPHVMQLVLVLTLVAVFLGSVQRAFAQLSRSGKVIAGLMSVLVGCAVYSNSGYWGFFSFNYSVPWILAVALAYEAVLRRSSRGARLLGRSHAVLGALILAAYLCHPLSVFFMAVYVTLRTGVSFAVRRERRDLVSWGVAFASFAFCSVFQRVFFSAKLGLDTSRVVQAWLHPFRPWSQTVDYWYWNFWQGDVFSGVGTRYGPTFAVVALGMTFVVAFALARERRTPALELLGTGSLFALLLTCFQDDLIPVHYPIGVYYNARAATVMLTVFLGCLGFAAAELESAPRRQGVERWARSLALGLAAAGVSAMLLVQLRSDFEIFDQQAKATYATLAATPVESASWLQVFDHQPYRYFFNGHFVHYACLRDGRCLDAKLFYQVYPDSDLYAVRPRRSD